METGQPRTFWSGNWGFRVPSAIFLGLLTWGILANRQWLLPFSWVWVLLLGMTLWGRFVRVWPGKSVWVWRGPVFPLRLKRIPFERFHRVGITERLHEGAYTRTGQLPAFSTIDVVLEGVQHLGPEFEDEEVPRVALKGFGKLDAAQAFARDVADAWGLPVMDHVGNGSA
jgi:hypothetical protein